MGNTGNGQPCSDWLEGTDGEGLLQVSTRQRGVRELLRPQDLPEPPPQCPSALGDTPSPGSLPEVLSPSFLLFTVTGSQIRFLPLKLKKKRSYIFYNKYLPWCNGFITVILNEFITTVNVTSFYVSHVKYLDTHLYEQKLLGASVIFKCREGAGITVQWIKLLLAEPSISCLNSDTAPFWCAWRDRGKWPECVNSYHPHGSPSSCLLASALTSPGCFRPELTDELSLSPLPSSLFPFLLLPPFLSLNFLPLFILPVHSSLTN